VSPTRGMPARTGQADQARRECCCWRDQQTAPCRFLRRRDPARICPGQEGLAREVMITVVYLLTGYPGSKPEAVTSRLVGDRILNRVGVLGDRVPCPFPPARAPSVTQHSVRSQVGCRRRAGQWRQYRCKKTLWTDRRWRTSDGIQRWLGSLDAGKDVAVRERKIPVVVC